MKAFGLSFRIPHSAFGQRWGQVEHGERAMDRLIVALDFPSEHRALNLVRNLKGTANFFKVGLQLFTSVGPEIVRKIKAEGGKVFLDLKFLDIPNTVSRAALEAARLGVHMLTFHALGGQAMLASARETLEDMSQTEGWPIPKLLGVTVLTSMDQQALGSVGIDRPLPSMVVHLARVARASGFNGIVCSPQELRLLRESGIAGMTFVTPGIRADQAPADDQARSMTAAEAIREGADYLVVGRPITQADEPDKAALHFVEEIQRARLERL